MTVAALCLVLVLFALLVACVKPLGLYIANVVEGRPVWITRLGGPLERGLYALAGVRPQEEMSWKSYALALIVFNTAGLILVYALQRLQQWLPLNPQGLGAVTAQSSFNTAVSFVTNTNWQGYSGEATMSYLTQMSALTVQNFLSAATGLAVAVALIRGFARRGAATIGNFWVDLTRVTLYVLLPLALLLAIALVSQGVVQNFRPYQAVSTLEPTTYEQPQTDASGNTLKDAAGNPVTRATRVATQLLPMGPMASQESIKELGTNGGGFLNANSAHPFENPTALSNLLEMLALLVLPLALTYTFGHMVGDTRQGWALLAAIALLLLPLIALNMYEEQRGNPQFAQFHVDQSASASAARRQHGRQGDTLWRRGVRAVRHGNHGHVNRGDERGARFPDAARRVRDPVRYAAWGSHSRWRRNWSLLAVDFCHRGGLHRRSHDRTHARIPG